MSSRPPGGGIDQVELEAFLDQCYDDAPYNILLPADLAADILERYDVVTKVGGRPARRVPLAVTIEEASEILRISRTSAYALANEWRHTNGESGLPVLKLGRTMRVPTVALARMLSVSVEDL